MPVIVRCTSLLTECLLVWPVPCLAFSHTLSFTVWSRPERVGVTIGDICLASVPVSLLNLVPGVEKTFLLDLKEVSSSSQLLLRLTYTRIGPDATKNLSAEAVITDLEKQLAQARHDAGAERTLRMKAEARALKLETLLRRNNVDPEQIAACLTSSSSRSSQSNTAMAIPAVSEPATSSTHTGTVITSGTTTTTTTTTTSSSSSSSSSSAIGGLSSASKQHRTVSDADVIALRLRAKQEAIRARRAASNLATMASSWSTTLSAFSSSSESEDEVRDWPLCGSELDQETDMFSGDSSVDLAAVTNPSLSGSFDELHPSKVDMHLTGGGAAPAGEFEGMHCEDEVSSILARKDGDTRVMSPGSQSSDSDWGWTTSDDE
jgi:hypothetical protein